MPSRILNPAMLFLARLTCAFWPVILSEILHRAVERPAVLHGLPDAHVHDDLLKSGYAHRVLYLEPVLERRGDLLPVPVL
jgi:hypothetical protein